MMSVGAIGGLSNELGPVTASAGSAGGSAAPFSGIFKTMVDETNDLSAKAQTAVTGLLSGSGVDVHQAMIATQKADVAFELALQVRNKAIGAYQTMMGMQF